MNVNLQQQFISLIVWVTNNGLTFIVNRRMMILGQKNSSLPTHTISLSILAFWDQTRFYYSMYWQGDQKLHWFNIYKAQRDIVCTDCFWSIEDNGPCKLLITQPNCSAGDKYVECNNWNPSEWAASANLHDAFSGAK